MGIAKSPHVTGNKGVKPSLALKKMPIVMRMNRPGRRRAASCERTIADFRNECVCARSLSFHLLLPPSGVNLTNYSFALSLIRSRPESKLTTPRLSFKLDSPNNDKSERGRHTTRAERALAQ
jgi:hypothetical protein